MNFTTRKFPLYFCVSHAVLVFCIGVLLFVSKWFPYGSAMRMLREWLYRFF
jgi:hypothetical protein